MPSNKTAMTAPWRLQIHGLAIFVAISVKNIIIDAIYLCKEAGYSFLNAVVHLSPATVSLQKVVRKSSRNGRSKGRERCRLLPNASAFVQKRVRG
jgi:hypothetical protein